MKNIKEMSIDGEKLYFKKDWLGYRQVYPIRNEGGKINWINLIFGGKRNIMSLILIIIAIIVLYIGISDLLSSYQVIAANPCNFCEICIDSVKSFNPSNIPLP